MRVPSWESELVLSQPTAQFTNGLYMGVQSLWLGRQDSSEDYRRDLHFSICWSVSGFSVTREWFSVFFLSERQGICNAAAFHFQGLDIFGLCYVLMSVPWSCRHVLVSDKFIENVVVLTLDSQL